MRREPPRYVRWCNVYLEVDSDRAIVAACFNHAGLKAEIAGEARLVNGTKRGEIGAEAIAALAACRWEPNFNYRDAKRSDWPAYQASEERSIKRFVERWRQVGIGGANDHNVTWVLSVALEGESNLKMTASVAPTTDPARLEHAIRYLGTQVDRFYSR
jgi:hypothetical protein